MASRPLMSTTQALSTPAQQAPWERDPEPLLDGFVNMYNPCVVEVDEAPRYRMWFFGWAASQTNKDIPGCDAIFHARSDDLAAWEVYAGVVDGEDQWDRDGDPETCLLYTSPSPRDVEESRMPSSA